ncbi:MAG TPA: thiolase family protein [Candidatus Paceibacterota bacterium]|nr:thiolase family protein [Candidatus Paceibacterota bacterium]HSA36740.1 thiolase family protein [Candidatus Paceibacterota bacterium]
MTKFNYEQRPWWGYAYDAAMEALEDAKMTIKDIDAVIFSAMSSAGGGEHQTHKVSVLSGLFKTNVPIIELTSVCGGGGVAFWTALRLLESAGLKNILVLTGEKLVDNRAEVVTDLILSAAERVIEQPEGLLFPVQNALVYQQYCQKYGGSHEDLELIALKNHQNAVLNPKAYYYKRPVTLEQIKKSPVVAEPLRLMDCSLSVNGGAAAIVSQEPGTVEIIGSGFATDYILTFEREDKTHFKATQLAAKAAFEQAKLAPQDIQVAEIHDAFTSVELISYEDLGFAEPGKGGELIKSGKINMGGEMPVNPSGGLKAKGHPISATGLAQIYEITNQLRGKCGERQVKDVKIGLAHNIGGAGGSVTVHILKKN